MEPQLAESPDLELDLDRANREFSHASAEQIIGWAYERFGSGLVMSSSFGATAAVMLHLVSRAAPKMPIICIDTGYLFPETYKFADELQRRYDLNLRWYSATMTQARQEALYGQLWDQGDEGVKQYLYLNKVEPMQRALKELGASAWYAGLRRGQSRSRARIRAIEWRNDRFKVHPIFDWNDRQVFEYMKQYDLPYHPLWDQGYVSIGDWHTTRPLHEAGSEEETRFFGLKRECGLHGLDG